MNTQYQYPLFPEDDGTDTQKVPYSPSTESIY